MSWTVIDLATGNPVARFATEDDATEFLTAEARSGSRHLKAYSDSTMLGGMAARWGGPPVCGITRKDFVMGQSSIRIFFDSFTSDQTDAMKSVVRTGQGLNLYAAIGARNDDESLWYLRKFARSLEPDQIEHLKKILTRWQLDAVSALTGQAW